MSQTTLPECAVFVASVIGVQLLRSRSSNLFLRSDSEATDDEERFSDEEEHHQRDFARREEVARLCTIIITTSPTPTNPHTSLIEQVIDSLMRHVSDVAYCRKIIVCDGYKIRENGLIKKSKFRSGEVMRADAEAYEAYVAALRENINAGCWGNAEVLRLPERRGFGYAVKAALERVATPFVCVIQHDRTFVRDFDHAFELLQSMEANARLKMVGLPTQSNDPRKHEHFLRSQLGTFGIGDLNVQRRIVYAASAERLRFLPLLRWHDSTHFAATEYYQDFVFGPRNLVSRGGFIEDKLGQQQIKDLRRDGWASHRDYGTYLLDDGEEDRSRMVAHLDGKRYIAAEDRYRREACNRRMKAMNALEGCCREARPTSVGA